MKTNNNYAFIDGQNLFLGTKQSNWAINHKRLRIYLEKKYKVSQAYYFLGYVSESNHELYSNLQKAGFIVIFKEHTEGLLGKKKGNIDTDLVFEIMKSLVDDKEMEGVVLISGDGDYKKLVDYLIKKDRFVKILFPNIEFAYFLYKKIDVKFKATLDQPEVRKKIEYKKSDKQ